MSGGSSGDNRVKETKAQKELSRISIDKYNDYQDRFAPLENRLMGEVRTTPAEYDQGLGQANAASETQFANARDQYDAQQFAHGVNPASGAYISGMGGLKQAEALGSGENMASNGQALSDQQAYGLMGVSQLGRGESTNAFAQYGRAASSAQSQAVTDARNALNESLANQQVFGQLAGAGAAMAQSGLQQTGPSTTPATGLTSVGSTAGYGRQAIANTDYSLSPTAGLSGEPGLSSGGGS